MKGPHVPTVNKSLQLQVLSWLAGLATLGAALKPTFDTLLFAAAFVLGSILMHVRERLERIEGEPKNAAHETIGKLLGVALAWGLVAARAFTALPLPARMSAAVLIAAAVVPTGIVAVEAILTMRNARRVRSRAASEE